MNSKQRGSQSLLLLLALFLGLGVCFAADSANYDTAWTYVYDGGVDSTGEPVPDDFRDVKVLPNGDAVCVGSTIDSAYNSEMFLIRLSPAGKLILKKTFGVRLGARSTALGITRAGEYLMGGKRYGAPFVLWLDSQFNVKRSNWYYDSIKAKIKLEKETTINSILETRDGRIFAVAGDLFPNNLAQPLNNYAALLEYDSLGLANPHRDWLNTTGYELAGWSLTPSEAGGFMLGGKQAVFLLDSLGRLYSKAQYSFSLPGVGSVTNNVSRVHQLRNGMVMVAGQSYEEDCWTRYQRLYYDAWWSPLSLTGGDDYRYTAGVSGAHDYLYDFTQLTDGRIAFVGTKGVTEYGLWAFVTDSTGKSVLWQSLYNLPGLDQGVKRNNLLPVSIAATPDSGFIVAGIEGGTNRNDNAFAVKFLPKPGALPVLRQPDPKARNFRLGQEWVFSFVAREGEGAELILFTLQGKRIKSYSRKGMRQGPEEIRVDAGNLQAGMYSWRLKIGESVSQGLSIRTE